MKRLVVFDLDGTLFESKAALDDGMAGLKTLVGNRGGSVAVSATVVS